MWYLIVSIPDLCTLTFLKVHEKLWGVTAIEIVNDLYIVYRSINTQRSKQICIYRGSYMSAHVLLNLLNEFGKRDKMRGLPSILSLFRNEFNKFNNTRARMLDSIYHMTNTLKSHFWRKNVILLSLCTQRCYGRHNVSRKSINH